MMTFGCLDLFMARSNMDNVGTCYFMERFEEFGLQIGTHSFLKEYMKICE